jgi:2-polyprenyl-3-methyl-5-hydroxy-6-metoxy-1,4-benzoquinol methylase
MKKTQSNFEKKWKERFEGYASHADDDAGIAGWSPTGLDARLRKFVYIWQNSILEKNFWLDAGCGAGTYSRFIARQGANVIGLDYSFPSLQKARLKGSESIAWCVADINKLPIKHDSFDGTICFGVTQALENSGTMIQGLSKATKPGGQVWIDALNGMCLPHLWERYNRRLRKRPMHLRYESHRNLRNLLKDNNIINIKLYWLPILPARWSRFQWIVETHFSKWLFRTIPFLGLLLSHAFILCGERAKNE